MGSIQIPDGQPNPSYQNPGMREKASSDVEDFSNLTLGYDLEDQQTRSHLELLDDLQRLGVSKYLDLPKLVVMGEQSVGKSSVLQAVTEIWFPSNEGMCTRFATEIVLKRTKPGTPTTIHVCIIPDDDDLPERKQALKDWSPEGLDSAAGLDKENMKDIFEQAHDMIFEATTSLSPGRRNNRAHLKTVNRLSGAMLQITRSGPKETNFAIVDIPGLVRGKSEDRKSEHRTATKLVEKYLTNPLSIIVVVIDVVDLERHEIFDLISDLPDKESRVVGVINKCDTKQKQSEDWVFDLIQNVGPKDSRHYLKEGWYGLRNRAASEQQLSDDERDRLEKEFFERDEWKSLNKERLGRFYLKKALIKMRNNHIKQSLPGLLKAIDKELDSAVERIDQLGKPRTTPTAQFAMINQIATNYSTMASGAVDGHYKNLSGHEMYARKLIRDNLDTFQTRMNERGFQTAFRTSNEDADLIEATDPNQWSEKFLEVPTYKWIRSAVRAYRAMEDGDEVNPEVKTHLWKEQTISWNNICFDALSTIERTVESVNEALFAAACPDKDIRQKLLPWLEGDFRAASNEAKYELKRILEDEKSSVMTLNPLRMHKQIAYRDGRIQAIKQRLIKHFPETALPQAAEPTMKVGTIQADIVINSLIYQHPELVGILNTHDSIAAYYEISLYRLIDNFSMQVVERHLLGKKGPLRLFNSQYVTGRLHGAENAVTLSELAGEDPEVARERDGLERKRVSLEEARKRAQRFKMLH